MKRTMMLIALLALLAPAAMATTGMNLEGYGPVSQAMGGTSMAFDNGGAALMNNPATIGLLEDGGSYLNLGLGFLGPDVTSEFAAMDMSATSAATAFYMPAAAYIRRGGQLTYGVGVFGQGGMGTDYPDDSFMAGTTGENAFSQVSVGRAMVPVAYAINEQLTVGATLDYVWGGMDIKMAMQYGAGEPGTLSDFMSPDGVLGSATPSAGLGGAMGGMGLTNDDMALISFADDSDFTGAAAGSGFGAKLGFLYKAHEKVTLGGAYHLKTMMGDWEADAASMTFFQGMAGADAGDMIGAPLEGKMTVVDFQWPATIAFGIAYQHCERLLLAADYRLVQWSGTMENFTMKFEVTDDSMGLEGETLDMTMFQNWDDQSIIQLGAAFQAHEMAAVRAGAVIAGNPIPDGFMNPLFPAIEENHFTGGLGLTFAGNQGIDLSFAVAPEVEQENSNTTVSSKHSQFNWQAMYTFRF